MLFQQCETYVQLYVMILPCMLSSHDKEFPDSRSSLTFMSHYDSSTSAQKALIFDLHTADLFGHSFADPGHWQETS